MQGLTYRQTEIMDYLQSYIQERGMPPTRAEIARHMGFRSPNAADDHLRALARKGVIELVPNTSRGIRMPMEQIGLPLVGQVAAGSPILAAECIDSYWQIPPQLFKPAADYLLTVKGDSMIDAGIHEGDLLAVRKTDQANSGDIIVARLEDDVTVKKLVRASRGKKLLLVAENQAYEPIEVDLGKVRFVIEGVCVGVIRRSL